MVKSGQLPDSQAHSLYRRSLWYNWSKTTQTRFCISIRPYFHLRKSDPNTSQNDKEKWGHPWIEVSPSQYEQLKKLQDEMDKPVREIVREAVSRFLRKKDHPVSIAASYLSRATREEYKTITVYFSPI